MRDHRLSIDPLAPEDTANYITHRLKVATGRREIYTSDAVAEAAVWIGAAPSVALAAARDVVVTVPYGLLDQAQITARYDGPVEAPIAAGDEIGGEFLSVASIEADVLLRGNYGMAFFYDIGSASNQLGQELKAGVGIGFRYKSPVGLIRIDFAHPLDDPDSDFRLHLTFGPDL